MKKQSFRDRLQKAVDKMPTFDVEAPSGLVYTLRRPNIQNFVASGSLPEAYLDFLSAKELGRAIDMKELVEKLTPADMSRITQFRRDLVTAACVVPKVVKDPKTDDEVRLDEIPDQDAIFIVAWSQVGGVEGETVKKS